MKAAWARLFRTFGPAEEPTSSTAGRLVVAATSNGKETALDGVKAFGGVLIAGGIGIPLGLLFHEIFFFAGIAAAVAAQALVPANRLPHDLHFYERALHGSLVVDGRRWFNAASKRLIRYEDVRGITLGRNGKLRIELRDAKSLRTETLIGAIPPSKREVAAAAVARLQGAVRELRLPDEDPRELATLRKSGW